MDTHNGLIFISLDPQAPPLRDYLGDFAFYLDFYTRQSPAGIELRGPQRWRVKASWKIGAENFAGDSYHTPHTHASVVDIGLFREPRASKRKEGALYTAGPGAGTTYKLPPGGDFASQLRYVGYPDAMIPVMAASWSERQRALIADMASGSMARRLNLNSRMGLTSAGQPIKPPLDAFAGPGVAYQGFGEFKPAALAEHVERPPGSRTRRCGGGRPGRCPVTAGQLLRYGDPAHQDAHQFLVEEAALLEVVVERVQTRNGARLRISVPSSGHQILLCPLELEALTWQDHEMFGRLLATPQGPEAPAEDGGA